MLLGKKVSAEAVNGLSAALSAEVPSGSAPALLLDPATTVLLVRALRESEPQLQSRTLEDLTRVVVDLIGQLRQVVEHPGRDAVQREVLQTLRTFCLALSRHAASISSTPVEGPEHPFRR